jgi:hypothetical protein
VNFIKKRVQRIIADGFEERQRIRQETREARNKKLRAYNARIRALEAALARERNSAIASAKAPQNAKLPSKSKAAGGSQ